MSLVFTLELHFITWCIVDVLLEHSTNNIPSMPDDCKWLQIAWNFSCIKRGFIKKLIFAPTANSRVLCWSYKIPESVYIYVYKLSWKRCALVATHALGHMMYGYTLLVPMNQCGNVQPYMMCTCVLVYMMYVPLLHMSIYISGDMYYIYIIVDIYIIYTYIYIHIIY